MSTAARDRLRAYLAAHERLGGTAGGEVIHAIGTMDGEEVRLRESDLAAVLADADLGRAMRDNPVKAQDDGHGHVWVCVYCYAFGAQPQEEAFRSGLTVGRGDDLE